MNNSITQCLTLALALAICSSAHLAQAQAPTTLTVQGLLKNADGDLIDQSTSFEFRLVRAGMTLWTEVQTVAVEDGLFTATLGNASPITADLLSGGPANMVIVVDSTMMPAIPLTSVPYALVAERANTAESANSFAGDVSWGQLTDIPTAFDDGVDNDSGGDVTSVAAGEGLSGGGESGDVALNVAFDGSGVATTAARSDHGHDDLVSAVTPGPGIVGGGDAGEVSVSADFGGTGSSSQVARADHTHDRTAGGVLFTRWGRADCPADTSLVYAGIAGGSNYAHSGSGTETLCLSETPTWGIHSDLNQNGALVYGMEYETAAYGISSLRGLQDLEAPCAVCLDDSANSEFMLPGTNVCPAGWNTRVRGYLMSTQYQQNARGWSCVDENAQARRGSTPVNSNGNLWYPTEAECGSLPCGPGQYVQDRELTCAICTR